MFNVVFVAVILRKKYRVVRRITRLLPLCFSVSDIQCLSNQFSLFICDFFPNPGTSWLASRPPSSSTWTLTDDAAGATPPTPPCPSTTSPPAGWWWGAPSARGCGWSPGRGSRPPPSGGTAPRTGSRYIVEHLPQNILLIPVRTIFLPCVFFCRPPSTLARWPATSAAPSPARTRSYTR